VTSTYTMSVGRLPNDRWQMLTCRGGPVKTFSSFKRLRHYLRIMLHDMFDMGNPIHTICVPMLMTIDGPYDIRWHDGYLEIAPYWRDDSHMCVRILV
jgi:hypothetical protein